MDCEKRSPKEKFQYSARYLDFRIFSKLLLENLSASKQLIYKECIT